MRHYYLTPAAIRQAIRCQSNWPEVRRPINVEAVGHYSDEVGAPSTPDDINDYEWQQAQGENRRRA
jgi:hypothetical protein